MEPPDYNLANITIPTALFYGPGDLLDNIMVNNEKIDNKNKDIINIKKYVRLFYVNCVQVIHIKICT